MPARTIQLAVAAATVVSVATNSMVTVVLPQIRSDYAISAAAVGWVPTSSLVALAACAPVIGALAIRYSPRSVFLAGLMLFWVGLVVAWWAPVFPALVLARVIQGVGTATVPVAGTLIVTAAVPHDQRGRAIAVIALATGVAQAGGPTASGLLSGYTGWQGLFAISALATTGVLIASYNVISRSPRAAPQQRPTLDAVGAVLLTGAISAILGSLYIVGTQPHGTAAIYLPALAVALIVAAVVQRHHAVFPLVPRGTFSDHGFATACAIGAVSMFVLLAVEVAIPLQVSDLNRLTPAQTGLVLLPLAIAAVTAAPLAGRCADRYGPRSIALPAAAVLVTATVILSIAAGGPLWPTVIGLAMIGAAFTTLGVATLHIGAGPTGNVGIYQAAFYTGGAIGASIAGLLITTRDGVTASWNPLHHSVVADNYADALLIAAAAALIAVLLSVTLKSTTPSRNSTEPNS